MNLSRILLLISSIFFIFACNDAAHLSKKDQSVTLRGRVTFPKGSRNPIETGSKLTVELIDISLADAPSKTISTGTAKVVRFPVAFVVKYSASQITKGARYSLSVRIKNKKDELLYINDENAAIVPVGTDRTKFITVPVKLIKQSVSAPKKERWPELLGTSGKDAVATIKKETGFTNVETLPKGSPITYDYRTDRVRVFVDGKGKVAEIPAIG